MWMLLEHQSGHLLPRSPQKLNDVRTPAAFHQIVDLLVIRRAFREVFGGIKLDNGKNIYFLPTVFVVRINGWIANEWFEIYVLVDNVTNDFKITSIEWYIFSMANNLIGQSVGSADESDIGWLIL